MSAIELNRTIAPLAMGAILLLIGASMPVVFATSNSASATLTSANTQHLGKFGYSVAVSGSSVVVGAPGESAYAGHAYMFSATGSLITTLTSPNAQSNAFGSSVAVSGNVVVVGAPGESAYAGHAYIFSTSGSLVATLASPNAQSAPPHGGDFGYSVAVSGSVVVVGAPDEDVGGFVVAGHAYIFSITGSLITTLTSPNAESGGSFGLSVATSDNVVVIGALYESGTVGRAYIFSNTGSLITTLTSPNANLNGNFGGSVAVSRSLVVVGARGETASGFEMAGHAYIFSTTGSLITTLTSPNAQSSGNFGSVAVSGSSVVVGALNEAVDGFVLAGHAYIFSTTDSLITTLTSPNAQSNGAFGWSVAVSGNVVVVGAPGESADAGHAYIFTLPTPTEVSKFFTDASLNPLPLDSKGNPMVNVTLSHGIVVSTSPGQVLAWVNVTNTSGSSLQSLKLNDTLPVDWAVSPPWIPGTGAIHVFYANTTSLTTNPDMTIPSTITVTSSNPQTVRVAISNFTATAMGHPLMPGESVLLSVKLSYGLIKTSQSATSYPRNYPDTATAVGWTLPSFTGLESTGTGSAFFVADAKVVG